MKEQKKPVEIPSKPQANPTQKGAPQAPAGQLQGSEAGIMAMIGRLTVEKALLVEQLANAQLGLRILQDKITELNGEILVLKNPGKKDPDLKVPV